MKKIILLLVIAGVSGTAIAQSVRVMEGSLAPLKGQSVIKTEFTYDNMMVGNGTESEYIAKKKTEYNSKEAGRGDTWEKAWYNDRSQRYEPQFNQLFTEYGKFETAGNSTYTMIFKTTKTEPGYYIGPFIGGHAAARINADVVIVETANPSKVIARIEIMNSPGRGFGGYDWDTGFRVQEAYAKAGKELGKFILSKTKK